MAAGVSAAEAGRPPGPPLEGPDDCSKAAMSAGPAPARSESVPICEQVVPSSRGHPRPIKVLKNPDGVAGKLARRSDEGLRRRVATPPAGADTTRIADNAWSRANWVAVVLLDANAVLSIPWMQSVPHLFQAIRNRALPCFPWAGPRDPWPVARPLLH